MGRLPACVVTLPAVTTARRPAWRAAVAVVALLAVGLGVALGVGSALGISAEPVAGMDAAPAAVGRVAPSVPPPTIEVVDAPRTERTMVALDELSDAVASAPSRQGRVTLTLRPGTGDPDDDTYRLGGTPSALEVTAASESGAVRAVYDLAAAVRSGRAVTERLGDEVSSRLPFRMVDLGAVGVTPDPARVGQRHRLLARLEGLRRRGPAGGALRRRGGPREGLRRLRRVRAAQPRQRLHRRRVPRLHRVRDPAGRPRRAGLRRGRRARRPGAGDARRPSLRSGTGPRSSA